MLDGMGAQLVRMRSLTAIARADLLSQVGRHYGSFTPFSAG
jgi:hypothetical protein